MVRVDRPVCDVGGAEGKGVPCLGGECGMEKDGDGEWGRRGRHAGRRTEVSTIPRTAKHDGMTTDGCSPVKPTRIGTTGHRLRLWFGRHDIENA